MSLLQQPLPGATQRVLLEANKVIGRARQPQTLRFKCLNCRLEDVIVIVCVDASQGSMPRSGSQEGIATLVANPRVLREEGEAVCLEWSSSRVKRVVRSSMACEPSGATRGFEHGDYVRAIIAELLWPDLDLRQ